MTHSTSAALFPDGAVFYFEHDNRAHAPWGPLYRADQLPLLDARWRQYQVPAVCLCQRAETVLLVHPVTHCGQTARACRHCQTILFWEAECRWAADDPLIAAALRRIFAEDAT